MEERESQNQPGVQLEDSGAVARCTHIAHGRLTGNLEVDGSAYHN